MAKENMFQSSELNSTTVKEKNNIVEEQKSQKIKKESKPASSYKINNSERKLNNNINNNGDKMSDTNNHNHQNIHQSNCNENNTNPPRKSRLWLFLLVPLAFVGILFLLLIISIPFLIFSGSHGADDSNANVAVIPIKGVLVTESSQGFFGSSGMVSSTEVIADIEKAEQDPKIKAIIFEIDSPGGSGVASDEIATKIKSLNKTTVAWVRELGASGAYWVASSTNHIVVHKMSFVGSIGVIASYLEFSGLMEKYGVGYERLTAGKYKDMGTPYRKLTPAETEIFQSELDAIHAYFIEEVAANRKLDVKKVKELATGQVFIGKEAKDLGLVDELGGKQEALQYIQKQINATAVPVDYKKQGGLLDLFRTNADRTAFYIGQGIGTAFTTEAMNSNVKITT